MPGRPSERHAVKSKLRAAGLHTVCEEARCPNICECFGAQTATFLILGTVCTRSCRFCGVTQGKALDLDATEAQRLAQAVVDLGIKHAVITSVTRDDLADGGAGHFVDCMNAIRALSPKTSVEVLVPDFQGDLDSVAIILTAKPDVFNHNVETVGRLYSLVRPEADLDRSLKILREASKTEGHLVKSGIMVGLGEDDHELMELIEQIASCGCHTLTIGQYLRPTKDSVQVARKVSEDQFVRYLQHGEKQGMQVQAGPLVRSSYRALEMLIKNNQVTK
jgi:lipoic acid synthetase